MVENDDKYLKFCRPVWTVGLGQQIITGFKKLPLPLPLPSLKDSNGSFGAFTPFAVGL